MGIGKEHLDCEPLSQALALRHLFAPIIRQGFAPCGGHVPEFLREALAGTRRIRPLHPGQDDSARCPLHQRADGRAMAGPPDQIASLCPGMVRVASSAGRSAMGVMWGIWPRRSVLRARGRRALRT